MQRSSPFAIGLSLLLQLVASWGATTPLVLCQGEAGHVAVELAAPDGERCRDLSESRCLSDGDHCQDTPLLLAAPQVAPAAGGLLIDLDTPTLAATALPSPARGARAAPLEDEPLPDSVLSARRTVVLLI